jgi:hypothetical protein
MKNLIEQWTHLHQNAWVSVQKLADMNAHLWLNMVQQQMDMWDICLESSNKQIQMLNEGEKMQDFLTSQPQLAEEFSKKVLNNTRETVALWVDTKNQWVSWGERIFEQTVESNAWMKPTSSA